MGDIGTKIASDRDLQDEVIAYLADARLRKQSAAVPLLPDQAHRAEKFARFLARRYYRDRLIRSFRYSRLFAKQVGRTADEVVDGEKFDSFLNDCVLGSRGAAERVAEMAVAQLSASNAPGPWWNDLLSYEAGFFVQTATAERGTGCAVPCWGVSAVCKQFEWNSPDVIRRIKAGEPVGDELRKKVTLLFSRTHGGRVYAVEIETTVESVFRAADGTRTTDEIAVATSLPRGKVSDIMTSLAEIGAVVVPPDFPA